MRLAIGACIFVLYATPVIAQDLEADPTYYSYHPMSIMALGLGFSPNNVTRARLPCVQFEKLELDNAALTTGFSETLVTNTDQLKQSLGLDAKVDASYLAFKGGATFSFHSNSLFSANSMTVVITAETEFGRRSIKPGVTLTKRRFSLLPWVE